MDILVYLKLIDAAELRKHREGKDFLGDKRKSPQNVYAGFHFLLNNDLFGLVKISAGDLHVVHPFRH